MSSNKDIQEEIAASLNKLSKSQITNTTPDHPSSPDSPRQTKFNIPKVRKEVKHERSPSRTTSSALLTPSTSPRNASNVIPNEEKLVENKTQITASILKTLLGVTDSRCGGLTLENKPCKRKISAKRMELVDSQIELMINLKRSSPELETELEKLVMLLHCDKHDCGRSKDSRIDAWMKDFPAGNEEDKRVISVERQIQKALSNQVSTQCLGITQENKRCRWRIGGRKVQNCTKTIEKIVKPEVYLDDAYLDGLLKVLETNMYCHIHLNKRPLKMLALWKSTIMEILKIADSELMQSIEDKAPEVLESQTQAPNVQETGSLSIPKSKNPTMQNQGLLTPRNSRSLSPEFDKDPASFWPQAYDVTPFNILPKSEEFSGYKSPQELVRDKMKEPLDSIDRQKGWVYLYEVKGNEGFVKIGYTGRSIETRHEEWGFDCNREIKVLYSSPSNSVEGGPNARRVESLCHAELGDCRVRIYCGNCLKQHIEWFEVSPAKAIAVIEKWSEWMATHPYRSTKLRSGEKWTLKEEEVKRAHNINRFMEEISIGTIQKVA